MFQKKESKLLGRWSMERDDSIVNTKIDLSNYDHCGTCGLFPQGSRFQDKINQNQILKVDTDTVKF